MRRRGDAVPLRPELMRRPLLTLLKLSLAGCQWQFEGASASAGVVIVTRTSPLAAVGLVRAARTPGLRMHGELGRALRRDGDSDLDSDSESKSRGAPRPLHHHEPSGVRVAAGACGTPESGSRIQRDAASVCPWHSCGHMRTRWYVRCLAR
jgi:hypothetical protein